MAEGFILVSTDPGKAAEVVGKIRNVAGVASADWVLGACDVVVRVSVRHADNITAVVLRAIQQLPGVERTVTCLAEDDAGA